MQKTGLIVIGVVLVVVVMVGSSYNGLVSLDQAVRAQWGQVENVYQRRSDLVPNLVETVKGAAAFEKETFTKVAEARAKVMQISGDGLQKALSDPEAFRRFQQAQGELSSSLSRLMAVSERYPDLKATAAFRDLQAQLEGTENRITVERMRFNETAQAFNTKRRSSATAAPRSECGLLPSERVEIGTTVSWFLAACPGACPTARSVHLPPGPRSPRRRSSPS